MDIKNELSSADQSMMDRLKRVLIENPMTSTQVSKVIGISRSTYNRFMLYNKPLSPITVYRMEKFLQTEEKKLNQA